MRAIAALNERTVGRVRVDQLRKPSAFAGAVRADTSIAVHCEGKSHHFQCEIKPKLSPKTVSVASAHVESIQRATRSNVVIVTEHVSQRLATKLLEQGVQFLDAVGNAHLADDGFFLLVTGQSHRPTQHPERFDPKTTWGRGSVPVVHRLLNEPGALQLSFRELATASTVSLGTVHNVMAELKARGFLRKFRGKPRLVEQERLFEQWVESYPQFLRDRLLRGRLTVPRRKDLGQLAKLMRSNLGERGWAMSGECAAWLMDGYLPPERMTLYGNGDLEALAAMLDARPAADGNIEVLQAFWAGHTCPGGESGLADPVLVYADLLYSQEPRAREAALRIRDEYLHTEKASG